MCNKCLWLRQQPETPSCLGSCNISDDEELAILEARGDRVGLPRHSRAWLNG